MLTRWPKNVRFSVKSVSLPYCSCSLHTGSVSTNDSSQRNHYQALGVGRNATKTEIRSAYVTLSKKYHPDSNQKEISSDSDSQEFVRVSEAYRVLSSPRKRAQYDRELAAIQAYYTGTGSFYGNTTGQKTNQSFTENRYGGYSPGRGTRSSEFNNNIDWDSSGPRKRPNHSKMVFVLLGLTLTVPTLFMFRVNHNYHKYYRPASLLESQRNAETYEEVREKARNTTVQEQLELLVARHAANRANNDDDTS